MSDRRYSFYASEEAHNLLQELDVLNINRSEFLSKLIESYGPRTKETYLKKQKEQLKALGAK